MVAINITAWNGGLERRVGRRGEDGGRWEGHEATTHREVKHSRNCKEKDSLRGSSVNIGTMQRRLAWPLRKDDTHKSKSV